MDLMCEERLSNSPFVERIWHSQGERAGPFISMAESECSLVLTKHRGKTAVTLRGPATRATSAFCPADAEFIGIQFRPGTFMPDMPAKMIMDHHDLNLPEAGSKSFWFNGSAWQYPDYENADAFVNRLVRKGLLIHDPVVDTILQGQPVDMSLRTIQRQFQQATGLTNSTIYQIHRAQYATMLLKQGVAILETVDRAGYFDQPHLTRSLKQFIGLTPAQIPDRNRMERLSFLYKKSSPWLRYNTGTLGTTNPHSTALAISYQ